MFSILIFGHNILHPNGCSHLCIRPTLTPQSTSTTHPMNDWTTMTYPRHCKIEPPSHLYDSPLPPQNPGPFRDLPSFMTHPQHLKIETNNRKTHLCSSPFAIMKPNLPKFSLTHSILIRVLLFFFWFIYLGWNFLNIFLFVS